MVADTVIVLSAFVSLTLIVTGFVAVFREDTMRAPWAYWTWAVVAVLVMSALLDTPMWIRIVNFAVMLTSAALWVRDWKETTR